MNISAARIGPTVWELDGPMPIEKRSNTEMATVADSLVCSWGAGCWWRRGKTPLPIERNPSPANLRGHSEVSVP
ncbi:hypothetical protein GCM10009544_44160 [Streptomyces stramineus]|uniref:Uncharacterized protein n=1 Tax=Streptomyces stramineus TaxID=173861 RepID=A0ABN1AIJ9_9ACTN